MPTSGPRQKPQVADIKQQFSIAKLCLRAFGEPPGGRRLADQAAEGTVEGSFQIVADAASDLTDAERAFAQQLAREMHPPVGEILDGGLADQFDEALGDRRARNRYFLGKFFDGPLPVRQPVQEAKRSALDGKVLNDKAYGKVYNLSAFKDLVEIGGAVEKPIDMCVQAAH